MPFHFETTIDIEAEPSAVWAVLTDASAYPGWNETVDRVDGTIALGGKITVHATGIDRAFPVKVATLDPPSTMVWRGGMPLGLFKGVRTFRITPKDEGVEFHMREEFSGALSGLIRKSMPDLTPSFETFARCLKAAAEAID